MFSIKFPWPLAPLGLPIVDWLPQYNRSLLLSDASAGLTVFIFLIPQGMSYALLAGVPPIYGLYTAIVPLFLYAIFGSSRQLSMGPMAITSLLLSVSVQGLGLEEASTEYIQAILNVSMVVGVVVLLLGMFRLGALANLISQTVLTGFMTASALVIGLNQIKFIFGIPVPRFDYTVQTIGYILTHLHQTNPAAITMGAICCILLYVVKVWRMNNKPTPERMKSVWFRIAVTAAKLASFFAILIGSFIAKALLDGGIDMEIVGSVPSGLLAPTFQPIPIQTAIQLVPSSIAIAFVAFAGNWAVAKKYSMIHKYEVDANQELLAEGICCIVGVFFNAFACSAGLSRSAVNAESGAMTQITGVIVASLMLLAVQFLTSLFYYIPMTVLGSIIAVSILSMLDFEEMWKAYREHRKDCIVMVCTFLFTFFVGVSEGLFVGIGISLAMIIHSTAFPRVVHLGKLPEAEGGHYKDISRYTYAEQFPGIAVIRMDATLFFGNAAHFKDMVLRAAAGEFHSHPDVPIEKIVIDATSWIDIDLAGVKVLSELKDELKTVTIAIANAKGHVRERLLNSPYINENALLYKNSSIRDAVAHLFSLSETAHAGVPSMPEPKGADSDMPPEDDDNHGDSCSSGAIQVAVKDPEHGNGQAVAFFLDEDPSAAAAPKERGTGQQGQQGRASFSGGASPEVELAVIHHPVSEDKMEGGEGAMANDLEGGQARDRRAATGAAAVGEGDDDTRPIYL